MQHALKTVEYKGKQWLLHRSEYLIGGTALMLSTLKGAPAFVCTSALDGNPPPDGHVYVKDYSENEGMLDALVKAGVVEDTGLRVPSGFVQLPVCKLLLGKEG